MCYFLHCKFSTIFLEADNRVFNRVLVQLQERILVIELDDLLSTLRHTLIRKRTTTTKYASKMLLNGLQNTRAIFDTCGASFPNNTHEQNMRKKNYLHNGC